MAKFTSQERDDTILQLLMRVAIAGDASPTNIDMAHATGMTPNNVSDALQSLEHRQRLKIERTQNGRRFKIVETGQWSDWGLKRPKKGAATAEIILPTEPAPTAGPGRDPCSFCGVRGDIGCVHQRRLWGEEARSAA